MSRLESTNPCPDENQLESFIRGGLGEKERRALDAHFDRCSACRTLVAQAVKAGRNASVQQPEEDPTILLATQRGDDAPPNTNAPPALTPDEVIDHYQIIRMLARGGMGEVYLARDTKLGRSVALKFVRFDKNIHEEDKERFRFEARAMARFSHPNIVAVYGVGEHKSGPYLALEYVEGRTLGQRARQERIGVWESIRTIHAVADALRAAHAEGILHRDLKPDNVLLATDGRVRVLDFGLAKHTAHEATTLRDEPDDNAPTRLPFPGSGSALAKNESLRAHGTPAYMAPEQWRGEEGTHATDVWAIGLMLYELVAGARPYAVGDWRVLCKLVLAPDPVPRLPVDADVPHGLARMIYACLEKRPEKRLTMAAVHAELEHLLVKRRQGTIDTDPFRGFSPFSEQHAPLFFGRDLEIDRFVERVRSTPILTVVGPAGAGKTSFIQAGLIPRLKESGAWTTLSIRPGRDPFAALEQKISAAERESGIEKQDQLALRLLAIARARSCRVLLFIDHFEELHTLVADEEVRARFLKVIASVADDRESPLRVVTAVREDFLGRLAINEDAARVLLNVVVLRLPDAAALEQVLTRPIETMGFRFDDESVPREMIASIRGEPAALALLQFAANLLWERRDRAQRLILRSAHDAFGGVAGALASHADGVLESLPPQHVQIARELLLRLVSADGTRRALKRSRVIDGLGPEAEVVLGRWIDSRLISIRKGQTELDDDPELDLVAALREQWKTLARWITESSGKRAQLEELEQAAQLWEKRGRQPSELWQGDALHVAVSLAANTSERLPAVVQTFLAAGQQKQRRAKLRTIGAITSAFLVLLAITTFVFHQNRVARREREQARQRLAAALRESADIAKNRGDLLEARAQLRSALETEDSPFARALWGSLGRDPMIWKRSVEGIALAFSPDGSTVAAGGHDRILRLIDVETGAERILRGASDQIMAASFAPGGRHVAAAALSGLYYFDLDQRTVKTELEKEPLYWVVFNQRGDLLATTSLRTIKIRRVPSLETVLEINSKANVIELVFVPGRDLLASVDNSGTIRLFRTNDGVETRSITPPLARHIAVSPDGRFIVSGSKDGAVRVFELETGTELHTFRDHTGGVYSVAFSRDGKLLASTGVDRAVRIYDFESKKRSNVIEAPGSAATLLTFGNNDVLAAVTSDRQVVLWDANKREAGEAALGHGRPAVGLAISHDSALIASGGRDHTVRLWNAKTGDQAAILDGHTDAINSVAFSPDDRRLVTASDDRSIRVWNVKTSAEEMVLLGHQEEVTRLVFLPDGRRIVSGGADDTLRIWDVATGQQERVLRGHKNGITTLAADARGERIASGSYDQTVIIWRADGELERVIKHDAFVFGVAFTPDGTRLATTDVNGNVRFFSAADGALQSTRHFNFRAYAPSFDPSGERLALPGADGIAHLLELETGAIRELRGHTNEVNRALFFSDGKRLATSSDDGTVRVFEVATTHPAWHGLLLTSPIEIYTQRGWSTKPGSAQAWRRAIEDRARLTGNDGATLCIVTWGERLERWDRNKDTRVFEMPVRRPSDVIALPDACLLLDEGSASLGEKKLVETGARAISFVENQILVAVDRETLLIDRSGNIVARIPGETGVSAVSSIGGKLVFGFEDGSIETAGARFDGTPTARVTRIIPGPPNMLIAGFANGELGVWSPGVEARLLDRRLHGAVRHLALHEHQLHVATELGSSATIDLDVFYRDYCGLMREVWQKVPVVWKSGAAAREPRPAELCAR